MTSKAYGALFLSPPILEEQKKGDSYLHTMVTDGSSRLRPGMELVLTRWIALSGTAKLAVEKEEELLKRFPETLVREAQHFSDLEEIKETLEIAGRVGTDHGTGEEEKEYYPLGEGGILKALWEIADQAGLGLSAELRKLPIRQETVEITELFDLDPYRMDSKGAVLIGTFHGMELTEELKRAGIPATVIGRVSKGPERILYNHEIKRYIEKPARTEKKENEG